MKKSLIFFIGLMIIFSIFLIFLSLNFFQDNFFGKELTGLAITTGSVGFNVMESRGFSIESPLNITYNFSAGDNYTLNLNVSIIGDLVVDNWFYTLWDLKNNELVNDSITFTPNSTFDAVRWSNKLYVYANSSGTIRTMDVSFFVNVSNTAPILEGINQSIYVCEGQSLDYDFNITDFDENSIEVDISPKNPFFVYPTSFSGQIYMNSSIISGILDKSSVGIYEETISASDGENVDTVDTNITVIEINNAPTVQNIGVQTVWTQGVNSTFYKQIEVTDVEDGNQSSGNFVFSIEFLNGGDLFNITDYGIMNFTPNSSQVGVYNITVCVNDTGISSPHENISLCDQNGGVIEICQNFSLTVTDENRAPTILDYYPSNLNLNVFGTNNLYFNLSEYDPDGTIPDAYWYLDGVLKEYDSGNLTDEFSYIFGCGVSGSYTIKAEITDGLLNDSVEWIVNVGLVTCPLPEEKGGGGGGGGGISCREKWVCDGWGICQNTEESLKAGFLAGEDYRIIKEQCEENNWFWKLCGVQIRKCFDLNNCNTTYSKPSEFGSCHYVEKPSCRDGVKNCHEGECELLIDCGGPCKPCPTCSDGIQNQKEEGVDCGGPCPWKCKIEKPLLKRTWVLILILIILLILIIIAILKIIKILKYNKSVSKNKKV